MTIYSSDKAVPYVYICTHKDTNQFYVGYREVNVRLNVPSHLDLPEYKTSSKIINPDWENYTWFILAEFFDPSHAYSFEQQLIYDNWDNPLMLNGHCNIGKNQFRVSGPTGPRGKQKNPRGPTGPNGKKGIPTGPNGKKGIPTGPSPKKGKTYGPNGKQRNPSSKPSPLKGIPNGRKGIPTGPSPLKGVPSPLKGRPSVQKGIPKGPNGKKGIPNGRKGIPTGPSPLKGVPSPLKGVSQKLVECPHCGLVGGVSAMNRWHFDNCPKKLLPSCRPIEYMPSNLFGSNNSGPTWIDCH